MKRAAGLGVALTLLAGSAGAQEHNPQFFPVGERAMGLGGAYTAHAGDASAVYYGAGGLVFGRVGSVQANLPLRLVDRYVLEGARADDGFDLEYRDGIGLPVYVGGAFRFGERVSDGQGRHALAAATFAPIRSRRRFVLHEDRAGGAGEGLSVRRDDIVRWYGISYAARVIDELGIGASVILATRAFVHEESGLVSPDGASFSARSTVARMNAEALLLRIAAHLELDPAFSVALTAQLPGWEIGARGSVGSARGFAGPEGVTTAFEAREEVAVRTPIPWQIRAGIAWRPSAESVVTADASVIGPVGSDTDPVTRFDLEPGAASAFGHYLETSFWGEPVVDAAVGARVTIEDRVSISAGLFTNLSSAPGIGEATTTAYQPDRTDLFGASLAFSYRSTGVDIAAGLVGSLGFGHGLRAIDGGAGGPTYERVGVESQSLYLFVSGAGRVGTLIREITDELIHEVEGDDRDEPEDETEGETEGETEDEPSEQEHRDQDSETFASPARAAAGRASP